MKILLFSTSPALKQGEASLGKFADIHVIQDKKDDVIVIPSNVVHDFNGMKTVKILKDGVPTDKEIKLGLADPYEGGGRKRAGCRRTGHRITGTEQRGRHSCF